jgi:hypothetical protein
MGIKDIELYTIMELLKEASEEQLRKINSRSSRYINVLCKPKQPHSPSKRTPSGDIKGIKGSIAHKENIEWDTWSEPEKELPKEAHEDNSIQESINYEPTPKEYIDEDFEKAKENREHIDNVMRNMRL